MADKLSKTARRSMRDEKIKNPVPVASVWKIGIKVGQGRKPDLYVFSESELLQYSNDPETFFIVRTDSKWVTGGTPTPTKAPTGKRA